MDLTMDLATDLTMDDVTLTLRKINDQQIKAVDKNIELTMTSATITDSSHKQIANKRHFKDDGPFNFGTNLFS